MYLRSVASRPFTCLPVDRSFLRALTLPIPICMVCVCVSETLNRTHDGFSREGGSVLMQRRTSINAAAHVNVPAHNAVVM